MDTIKITPYTAIKLFLLALLLLSAKAKAQVVPFGVLHNDEVNDLTYRDTETAVVELTSSTTGRIWMDRDLGASQVATSSKDYLAYGDLYQWGRGADGHQTIVWISGTESDGEEQNNEITTTSSSTAPGTAFITTVSNNWYTGSNPDNLWQGVGGVNNPCPSGYRVPTEAEWKAELDNTNNAQFAWETLRLPLAGSDRSKDDGSLANVGTYGCYWSSTVSGSNSRDLCIYKKYNYITTHNRAVGKSVRCIKE